MIVQTFYRNLGQLTGDGYLGGDPPTGDDDGRAKIVNVPSRIRVSVFVMHDAVNVIYVGSVLSGHDGVWRMAGIDRALRYRVIGTDLNAGVNSAIQDWVTPAKMVS
ncbi:hypothetical protein HH110_08965 [Stenotrophomonas sp. SAM-B]|uniref:hypothetical protein n=1 Tax=Stenotrophomonas sp. SAM-B TaxID=2729141 RepID=UPI0015A021F0|nr:hypothetical protein [Stenotrophomonas sp. SAM-B]NWF33176.1 hypothetical protein [Stenotrophomonas sp. SAM-B]